MIDVYVEGLSIDIGRQGENLAKNIYFDLSELINTYGEGTATLVHMRPSDKAPYVCAVTRSDTFLIWAPTSTDTSYAGAGKCELRWVVGDVLAKSIVYRTFVAESITGDSVVPSEYESWYDALLEHISEYEIASDQIETNTRNIATNTNDIAVLDGRVDELTTLPEGSTTGDAELTDIRVGADGTQYETAGEAVRTQIADVKSTLGLSDYHSLSDGYFNTDGSISSPSADAEKYTSNYIAVIGGETLEFYVTLNRTNWQWGRWIFYDKDKSVIGNGAESSSYVNPMIATITVPENAEFIRLSFRSYNNLKSLKLSRDTSIIESLLGAIDKLDESTISVINDGYYSVDWVPNKRISRDDGSEVGDSDYSATGFIAVPPYTKIQIYTGGDNLTWGAVYDSNKDYIDSAGWNGEPQERFNNSANTIYYRISAYNNNLTGFKVKILPYVDLSLSVIGVPADAKTVGDRISSIAQNSGVIPSYYESQLSTKESIIRGHFDNCAFNGDSLIFLTDTHFSSDLFTSENPTSYFNANNSFSLIKDIISKCSIDKIVFGGDLVNSAQDIDTMLLCMSTFCSRFGDRQDRMRYCVGNHEYFTGNDLGHTTKPTPGMLYGAGVKYNEDIVLGKGDMVTYYFDNALQKIRYFVVSCGRDTETTTAQIAWLLNAFKEIPANYKVVVIGHGFIADNMTAFRGSYAPIATALDAVKAKTAYVYNNITYDYSTLSNVDVVCMITGHTHIDGSIVTTGGIPCICTTTDSYAQNYELVNGTPTIVERQKGTVNEQAFDIYQFDFTNRKIYVTRIGYGSDREFSY